MKKKLTWEYLVAIAGVVVTLLLVWFIGIWVKFPDSAQGNLNLLILRLGIFVLGILCVVGFLLWAYANAPVIAVGKPELPKVPGGVQVVAQVIESDVAPDNIDRLIREAELKVSSSRLGHGAKLSALPTILILGETGAGKTSVVLNCGLDAELLAGQI
jgi:type VI protein secretion system component VasK